MSLVLVLELMPPWRSQAAQLPAKIRLDADDLSRPIVLDQNGEPIPLPSTQHPGPVVLANGAVPTYLAYQVDRDDSLPKGIPTIHTGPAHVHQTTGPLHLDELVKAKLDGTLAEFGRLAVHTSQETYLVEPLAPVFGNGTSGASGSSTSTTGLEWLASQAPRNASGPSQAGGMPPAPGRTTPSTSQPQIQNLIPGNVGDSQLWKDLKNLFQGKSGKLVSLNLQSLDLLKRDLKIGPPQSVASHASTPHSVHVAAQQLGDGPGPALSPQPVPIPEPGTLVFFGLVLGAWCVRQGLSRRRLRRAV